MKSSRWNCEGDSSQTLRDEEISANFQPIQFVLEAEKPENRIEISFSAKPDNKSAVIPKKIDGIFASTIVFDTATIAFWALVKVTTKSVNGGVRVKLSNFSLRDICVLGQDETFKEFAANASASLGLGLVVTVQGMGRSDAGG